MGFRQAERGEASASFSLPFEYVTKSKNNREKNGICSTPHRERHSRKAGGLGSHIDRTKNVPNADPALSEKNFYVRTDFEKGLVYLTTNREIKTLQERINGRIQEGYKGKTAIRKDAVTHLNIVLTGSHKEMKAIEGMRKS